ncbi:uncharacterized protein PODANS_6_2395 [Podospora anserina S mat+]|uniref:Podospora anserina S mat+ genomic DNA chromosome 6, supercontig 2 n=4 Tax=Podospora TaxID=5144 RepID=B2B2Q6_PODAN|nr:uncharacterized protein PODANS_6_2395 [Podospora anserina S mat+]KAK4662878.1 hypothetical protein QC763_602395 [Podospora pseudopauciseta]KAK4671202.1 hypothetical protein QC764_602395 [Podospora pseudoanserina]VBB83992.1 Putative protein of unknown function [Podospora comata]CAP71391.1 unnamed protein product [Podospora anserina S mat+]CDP30791.1 Putative protein of unknown function [Podospora anserina S mat+]
MQFTNNLLALLTLLPLTLAAPESQLEAKFESGVSILGTAVVTTYSGDACNGSNEQVTVTNGGYRCFAVSNKRSIGYSGSGCTVTTWSGNNCRGSSFVATRAGCYSVLYGSVSIQC